MRVKFADLASDEQARMVDLILTHLGLEIEEVDDGTGMLRLVTPLRDVPDADTEPFLPLPKP